MARLVWLTDLHLNFVDDEKILPLAEKIWATNSSGLLIGGDLGEASSWLGYLEQLEDLVKLPLYFVLGNHDYYGDSIFQVRQRAKEITQSAKHLFWLPACDVISLDSQTALVGHGGWGDARAAAFCQSSIVLNDYTYITELRTAAEGDNFGKTLNAGLESQLQDLGNETAQHFRRVLPIAFAEHDHVIVLMHVPPFREACWHDDHTADDNWAPHFCCIAAGEALVEVMNQHPQKQVTVFCGHTHSEGQAEILPNLKVFTGGAEYGEPEIQRVWDTETSA